MSPLTPPPHPETTFLFQFITAVYLEKAVYDGGAISVDTVSGGDSSGEETSASTQALNATVDDENSVHLLCQNTTFVGNVAGERGGSLYSSTVVVMALTGVVLVVGVVIVLNDLVGNPALTDLSETHFSVMSRRIRTIPFHKLKIPFVVLQIITQYASITSIEFAPVFQTFLSTISVINLDLGWVLTSVCIIDVNFYGNLIAATVGPLMVLLVLAATYLYTW
ncbi:hypothetical protein Esi_1119_0003 [Ectocarpus siliculosus]|uniref:Uncharacterized protein n=1 Tax=Ectocarpus siliculosus TaxID=2880 RepID=D7FHV0_ECTSI|nr:hypothetical protein Esi_1119_0003 [Ectocarpus siliculosus]|eukprot:CBJ34148.1 hypothetical protein Esi_1119_0003 [Ectocarpus siliculosus]